MSPSLSQAKTKPPMTGEVTYSAVIPVFNAASTLERVVEETAAFFQSRGENFEILLVNDGSTDNSWTLAESLSKRLPFVTAVELTRNFGQHAALICGFKIARGNFIITMDDDLQNPASEIAKLIQKAGANHDLVFGKYIIKQHAWLRRVGSAMVQLLQERIFNKPSGLAVSNFRLIRRDVAERVLRYEGPNPYLPGLLLWAASQPAHAEVEHRPSAQPKSRYTTAKLFGLVGRLLFHYSVYPLRVLIAAGGIISAGAFLMGSFFFIRRLLHHSQAAGWTSLVVLMSFFFGFIILLLGVLGEYLLQIIKRLNQPQPYFVRTISRHGE